MNYRKLICFDFETDGIDPNVCNPVQLAAKVIDPRTLEFMPNGEFHSWMKPPGIDKPEYLTPSVVSTVEFHAKNYKTSTDDILNRWKEAPDQAAVWKQFSKFVGRFNPKNTMFWAPIPCGANIKDFDLIITKRLNEQYGIKTMFWLRDYVDILNLCFTWFENLDESPNDHKMNTLREFFGMPTEGSHDAQVDVEDTAKIIIRFLKLHRRTASIVKFKGAFANDNKTVAV